GLAAADERREQVDDLDARLEQLGAGRKLGNRRRFAVNWPVVLRLDWPPAVDRLAEQIEHAAQSRLTDWDGDWTAGVEHVLPAHEAVGAPQGDAPHAAAAQMLLHLAGEIDLHALLL